MDEMIALWFFAGFVVGVVFTMFILLMVIVNEAKGAQRKWLDHERK